MRVRPAHGPSRPCLGLPASVLPITQPLFPHRALGIPRARGPSSRMDPVLKCEVSIAPLLTTHKGLERQQFFRNLKAAFLIDITHAPGAFWASIGNAPSWLARLRSRCLNQTAPLWTSSVSAEHLGLKTFSRHTARRLWEANGWSVDRNVCRLT